MNAAAVAVMADLADVVVGYGVSDEYRYVFGVFGKSGCYFQGKNRDWAYGEKSSFVFQRSCSLFERRER